MNQNLKLDPMQQIFPRFWNSSEIKSRRLDQLFVIRVVVFLLCFSKDSQTGFKALKMIQAILVFNNHGKPRLTKFYTYFVSVTRSHGDGGKWIFNFLDRRPATTNHQRDFPASLEARRYRLQLPRVLWKLSHRHGFCGLEARLPPLCNTFLRVLCR